ncbi:MAG: GldG family protein [Myxococcota bacterium]|nr:GldG family protein [Myxococcota bacterium]
MPRSWKAYLSIGLMLSAAYLLNALMTESTLRFDLTKNNRNTLSDMSINLLKKATETIEIHAYFPSHLPAPYHGLPRAIDDILTDYQAASKTRTIVYKFETSSTELSDAERDEIVQKANSMGISHSHLDVIENDRRVRRPILLGIAILYGDRRLVTPPVRRASDLEYAITSTLRTIINGEKKRPMIGFATGHGEPNFMASPVKGLLSVLGEISSVHLDGRPLPPHLNTLLIIGPRRPFNDRCVYLLEQFLMRGGRLILMLDYRINMPQFPSVLIPFKYGLEHLFHQVGIGVDHTQVLIDRTHHGVAPTRDEKTGTLAPVRHPGFIKVKMTAKNHPLTDGIHTLLAPFASPIEIKSQPEAFRRTVLMKSHESSISHPNVREIAASAYQAPKPGVAERPGAYPIAILASGLFKTTFDEETRPVSAVEKNPLIGGGGPAERPFLRVAQSPGKLLLVSSGARFLGAHPDALVFLQNAVDWFVTDSSLASVRARDLSEPELHQLDAAQRSMVRWSLVLGPAIGLVLVGLARRWLMGR